MAFELDRLDGRNGFRIDGIRRRDPSDLNRFSLSDAGDVNGDGFDDIIVGDYGASRDGRFSAGESYVVFGTAGGFGPSLSLSALDGTNGFRIEGIDAYEYSGTSVSAAGDVNGDGIDDFIVGAPGANRDGSSAAGASHLIFGAGAGFGARLSLLALDGTNGFRIDGIDVGDSSGRAVSGAGDVNGDGFDDIIVGAPGADPDGRFVAGETYVVFGAAGGFRPSLRLSALNGTNGFRLDGVDTYDFSGGSVSTVGDVNGDGFDDVIVGASRKSYVVFGAADGFGTSLALSSLDGTNGFRIDGVGSSVSGVGDVNGDGFDDFVVGVYGERFVVFGAAGGFGASLALTSLDGTNGFRIDGDSFSVSGAGDVNGDGFDDVIVGASFADPDGRLDAGESYLVFGSAGGFGASLSLSALDGTNGFRIVGSEAGDQSGFSVSGAGDVNGDGLDDVIIGAMTSDRFGRTGPDKTYLVFGSATLGGVNDTPVAEDDTLMVGVGIVDLSADNGAGFDADPDFDDLTIIAIDAQPIAPGEEVTLDSGVRLRLVGGTKVAFDAPSAALGDVLTARFAYTVTDPGGATDDATVDLTLRNDTLRLADPASTIGFRIDGGGAVSGAGDLNGDGFEDIIVAASLFPYSRYSAGESYVVFGSADGFGESIALSALDGANGFRIDGIDPGDRSGRSVSGAGDVNGDGFDDIIVGATGGDPNGRGDAGESYVVFGAAGGFGPSLSLSALDGTNGFRIDGIDPVDRSGYSVSGAGDVNGDGFDDIIVGATGADPNGRYDAGESYVVFGAAGGFGPSLSLSALNGTNGFRIEGVGRGDESGFSVSGAGDVNGDGFDDIIVGAIYADPDRRYDAGASYVVFGAAGGFEPGLALSALDGTNGFRIDGIRQNNQSGRLVSGAGDVNGDGFDDVLIIKRTFLRSDERGGTGPDESYIVFGAAGGFGPSFALSALDGTNGFRIVGIDLRDTRGRSVAGAGDVNGDGFDDVIVGEFSASHVVFGAASGFGPSLALPTLDGTNGFRIDNSGGPVSGVGDVNGDGFDDIKVGAFGGSYVIFGRPSNAPPTIVSSAMATAAENQLVALDVQAADDADAEGAGLRFTLTGGADEALFAINAASGVLSFLDAPDFERPGDADGDNAYEAQITVTDSGGLTAVQTVAVTVTDANDAPTFGFTLLGEGVSETQANAGIASTRGELTITDVDAADAVTVSVTAVVQSGDGAGVISDADLLSFSTLVNLATQSTTVLTTGETTAALQLRVTPDAPTRFDFLREGDALRLDLTFTATDFAGQTDTGVIAITVTGENDAPALSGDFAIAADEGATVVLTTADLSGSDAESGAEELVFILDDAINGSVLVSGVAASRFTQADLEAGMVAFAHDGSETLTGGFDVTLSDGDGASLPAQTVTAMIAPVNRAPTATAIAPDVTAGDGSTYAVTVTYNDIDGVIDLASIGFTDLTVSGAGGSLPITNISIDKPVNGAPRTVIYTFDAPGGVWDANDNGVYTVALAAGEVRDVEGLAVAADPALATFTVAVPVASAPPFRIEAEDMELVRNYAVRSNPIASDGGFILGGGSGGQVARHSFTGAEGFYDLTIGYFDESDGAASMAVFVNGLEVDAWVWDQDLASDFISAGNLVRRTIQDIPLQDGFVIELRGDRDAFEPVRTDYLDFVLDRPFDGQPPPLRVRIEAEDLELAQNYAVRSSPVASAGGFILGVGGAEQIARYTVTQNTGLYDLTIGYFDEADGAASMAVFVNDVEVDDWIWDLELRSDFISADNLVERRIQNLALETGDVIELRGDRDAFEPVRTDYIELLHVGDLPIA